MLNSIQIRDLRGIRAGHLESLAPLTVLTGPNGCGKSTVLEAILIAAHRHPARAVGLAVERHRTTQPGAPWLIRSGATEAVVAAGALGQARLEIRTEVSERSREKLLKLGSPPPYTRIGVVAGFENLRANVAFGSDNQFTFEEGDENGNGERPRADWPASGADESVVLVEPGLATPLHRRFTSIARKPGRRHMVESLVAELVPGFERLEIMALSEQEFALGLTRSGQSIPIGLAGDGIQALVQVALGIALGPDGVALVEEPETYLHPKAIWLIARALLAAMRTGVQIVLTTHSLELIDALLAEAKDGELERMAVFNLALVDGELRTGRRAGEEIRFARETLENDLR